MPIATQTEYDRALARFAALLDAEPENVAAIVELRDAIAAYERAQGYELPPPQTPAGRLALEMQRRHLTEAQLADLLEIPAAHLNEVLQGRGLDLPLAKRLHQKLGIPGDFILEAA